MSKKTQKKTTTPKKPESLKNLTNFTRRTEKYLVDLSRKQNPGAMNTWEKIVSDLNKGLIEFSKLTGKNSKTYDEQRQRMADQLFKIALNFQRRTRDDKAKQPISHEHLCNEAGGQVNLDDRTAIGSTIFNNKLLNLVEGIFEEEAIEDRLIDLLKIHRARMIYKQKVKDYYGAKIAAIRAEENNTRSTRGRVNVDTYDTTTTTTSDSAAEKTLNKRKRDSLSSSSSSKKQKKIPKPRFPRMENTVGLYTPEFLAKAHAIRSELMGEVIVKWGFFDYKHMMAARQIEAGYYNREIEPGLKFGKFCGRFFSSKFEETILPRIRKEKKLDPDFKILPIVARDTKHAKGYLSFKSVERDIRGKRGGNNWQIKDLNTDLKGHLDDDFNDDSNGTSRRDGNMINRYRPF